MKKPRSLFALALFAAAPWIAACDDSSPVAPGPDATVPGGSSERTAAVSVVDAANGTIRLTDGTTVSIPGDDVIDLTGDLFTLEAVEEALRAGRRVRVEIELESRDGALVVVRARFEIDEADDDGDDRNDDGFDDEVEGAVTGVDLATRTVTLAGGTTFLVSSDDLIERDGDLLSLDAVAVALADGRNVRAEADVVRDGDGLRATSAKFEVDEDDDDDDRGDNGDDDRNDDGDDDDDEGDDD